MMLVGIALQIKMSLAPFTFNNVELFTVDISGKIWDISGISVASVG